MKERYYYFGRERLTSVGTQEDAAMSALLLKDEYSMKSGGVYLPRAVFLIPRFLPPEQLFCNNFHHSSLSGSMAPP